MIYKQQPERQMPNDSLIRSLEELFEENKISSLRRVVIDPIENTAEDKSARLAVLHEQYQVMIFFKAVSLSFEGSVIVVVERFASECLAMTYVLAVFEALVKAGKANRADIAPWRRALIVPVAN